MKKMLSVFALSAAVAAAAAAPAVAHHSFAMFDLTKQIQVEGKVKSFAYTNPHAWLYVDGQHNGKAVTWAFELGAPTLLSRQKIFPTTFKAGDTVKIDTSPLRDGRPGGTFVRAIKPDGSVIGRPVQNAAS